jgi:hypothetical protein
MDREPLMGAHRTHSAGIGTLQRPLRIGDVVGRIVGHEVHGAHDVPRLTIEYQPAASRGEPRARQGQ